MLLDPETFDLVQHVDTVLGAITGSEFEAHVHPELMQSVLEVATPVCRTPADVERALRQLRGYVTKIAQEQGLRVGSSGTHPFSLFERQRITARDRYRNLIDQMQYVARRELIFGLHVHVAVGDPDTAIQVVNGLLSHLASLLALSASSPFWRGEPTGLLVVAADGVRGVPALGPAAALPRLRRVRGGRRPAREDGLHRGLHAHLVGHPAASAARHGRGAHLRRGHAARGRRRHRRIRPVARQAPRREARVGRGDPDVPPHPHDREQVARRPLRPRGAGDGPHDGQAESRARRAADPAHAQGARAARARARRRPRARGHPQHPRARQRLGPAAADLQREPRHRRGRERDRRRDRGRPVAA